MSAPTIATTGTLTFNSVVYKVESMPAGKGRTKEAIEVTCCDDPRKQYVPGAIATNDDIEAVISGDSAPAINTKAALTLTVNGTGMSVGDAVAVSVKPADITTDNNSRKLTWNVTFRPCGANPPSASNG